MKNASSIALMDALGSFIRAYKGWTRSLMSDISSNESNPSRVMIVISLRKSGAQTMGGLAMHLGLPKSNITALVDDLEGEGLLRRMQDAVDRRVTMIELTAKGRTLCEREYDGFERGLASLFDVLPPEERGPMLAALERLTKAMRERAEPTEESCLEPNLNGSVSAKAGKLTRKPNPKTARKSAKLSAGPKSFRK